MSAKSVLHLLSSIEGFHILLRYLIIPHFFFYFLVFAVSWLFLWKLSCKFFIQFLYLRNFSIRQFWKCFLGCLMKSDFIPVCLEKFLTVPFFPEYQLPDQTCAFPVLLLSVPVLFHFFQEALSLRQSLFFRFSSVKSSPSERNRIKHFCSLHCRQ